MMAETFRIGRYQVKRKHCMAMQILPSDLNKLNTCIYLHFGCYRYVYFKIQELFCWTGTVLYNSLLSILLSWWCNSTGINFLLIKQIPRRRNVFESLVKLSNSISAHNFGILPPNSGTYQKKRSLPNSGSTSVWIFISLVAKWVYYLSKNWGARHTSPHSVPHTRGWRPLASPKSTPVCNSTVCFSFFQNYAASNFALVKLLQLTVALAYRKFQRPIQNLIFHYQKMNTLINDKCHQIQPRSYRARPIILWYC